MSNRKGFTLIEMLIVIAIIGIVLSIAYPSLAKSYDSSKENDRARQEIVVNKALMQHFALTGKYPTQGLHSNIYDVPKIIPAAEQSTMANELLKQTGVSLNLENYSYTYGDTDNDGKYEIISLQVVPK